jgi:8-oxo-dGTP diphosphatase
MIMCEFENGNQNSLRHVTAGCLVIQGDKILLGKRSKGLLEAAKWSLLGGYVNRDETVEAAALRETMEESGWAIRNMQLLRVNDNPDRPHEDRQNVDFIYIAEAVEESGEKDWETEEIKWFALDSLPPRDEIAFDHFDNIELYRKYLRAPFPLPVVGRISLP